MQKNYVLGLGHACGMWLRPDLGAMPESPQRVAEVLRGAGIEVYMVRGDWLACDRLDRYRSTAGCFRRMQNGRVLAEKVPVPLLPVHVCLCRRGLNSYFPLSGLRDADLQSIGDRVVHDMMRSR